jgi:hypothetical protein
LLPSSHRVRRWRHRTTKPAIRIVERSPPIDSAVNFAFTKRTQEAWDDDATDDHCRHLDLRPDFAVRDPTMETC